jgi:cell division protein ZapA
MSDNKSLVRVKIVGEEYTLRTDASVDHTRMVADHVDKTIRAVMSSGATVETHKAAILAALQITDDLFKERAATDAIGTEIRQLSAEIRPLLPPAKRRDDVSPNAP